MDTGIGSELIVNLREQRDGMSGLDVINPVLDHSTVGDIGAEKQEVVGGQVLGEFDNLVEVAGFHHANDSTPAVAQFKFNWIRAIHLALLAHRNLPRSY